MHTIQMDSSKKIPRDLEIPESSTNVNRRVVTRLNSWHPNSFNSRQHLTIRRKSLNDIHDSRLSQLSAATSHLKRIGGPGFRKSISDSDEATDSDGETSSDFGNVLVTTEDDSVTSSDIGESDSATEKSGPGAAPNFLRSDSRIRKGYLASLGIGNKKPQDRISSDPTMGVHAKRAAMASARTRRKPPALRMKLKDDKQEASGFGQALLKKFASWMTTEEESKYKMESRVVKREEARKLRQEVNDDSKKQVVFLEETDVHFVPSRSEISPRNRARLWHSREEFIDMVVRNMDQVEDEMNRKAEAKRRLEDLKKNPPPPLRPRKEQKK